MLLVLCLFPVSDIAVVSTQLINKTVVSTGLHVNASELLKQTVAREPCRRADLVLYRMLLLVKHRFLISFCKFKNTLCVLVWKFSTYFALSLIGSVK